MSDFLHQWCEIAVGLGALVVYALILAMPLIVGAWLGSWESLLIGGIGTFVLVVTAIVLSMRK